MRARTILTGLFLCAAAGGCQVIAQLNVLQVTGTGGAGAGGGAACADSMHCSPQQFCGVMGTCDPCGSAPGAMPGTTCTPGVGGCDGCATDGTCIVTCDAARCGPQKTLAVGTSRPLRVDCNGLCDDMTIQCMGPNRCDVVCGPGGCQNLTMMCSTQGPCTLTCNGASGGCTGAQLECGDNDCSVGYGMSTPGPMITPTCGHCGCQMP